MTSDFANSIGLISCGHFLLVVGVQTDKLDSVIFSSFGYYPFVPVWFKPSEGNFSG